MGDVAKGSVLCLFTNNSPKLRNSGPDLYWFYGVNLLGVFSSFNPVNVTDVTRAFLRLQ